MSVNNSSAQPKCRIHVKEVLVIIMEGCERPSVTLEKRFVFCTY
jgi:hypothetical protein